MSQKKEQRLRRSRRTRLKIAELRSHKLSVHRTNTHIYAQIYSPCGQKVLASASSLQKKVQATLVNNQNRNAGSEQSSNSAGKNIKIAEIVGQEVAVLAKSLGIDKVVFDRSGFRYHGRVKVLAEAARGAGLIF